MNERNEEESYLFSSQLLKMFLYAVSTWDVNKANSVPIIVMVGYFFSLSSVVDAKLVSSRTSCE